MTGNFPSFTGRKTSARRTNPSSIVTGTSQSIRMPSRISVRCCTAIKPSRDAYKTTVFRLLVREATKTTMHGTRPAITKKLARGLLAPLYLRHLFQHGADRSGVVAAKAAFHGLEVDAFGCIEHRRRYANLTRVVSDHLHIFVPHRNLHGDVVIAAFRH